MSGNCEQDGTPCSGGERLLICPATCCFLDRIGSGSAEGIDRLVADLKRSRTELRPGTLLTREWDGHLQRVMVLADGFTWNGKTYRSLSKVAFAITGSRWSGPRFFGLRDRPSLDARP